VGGDSSTNFGNVLVGKGTVHQHGLTVEQMNELKKHVDGQVVGEVERFVNRQLEVLRADFVKYTGQANEQALIVGQRLLTEFIEQLAAKAPENIDSIKTVSMQQAILNAQTSAAVSGDEELTQTLVDILIDKSGSEPRSFKGVVLTEALQVAGKLTADQVNLLTALVVITRSIAHGLSTVDSVLDNIDSSCRFLYGNIPTSDSAVQYMEYTGVGGIERLVGGTMAEVLVQVYDGIFTQGFTVDQLPDELKPLSANLPEVDERIRIYPDRLRFPLASSQSLDFLANRGELNEPYSTHVDAMKPLIGGTRLPVEKFTAVVESVKPNLAQFLRDLDQLGARTFMLTPVGIAIGQANWRRLQPEAAPNVDVYFR
jgi:hypothetical protein